MTERQEQALAKQVAAHAAVAIGPRLQASKLDGSWKFPKAHHWEPGLSLIQPALNAEQSFRPDYDTAIDFDPIGIAVRRGLHAGHGAAYPDSYTLMRAAELVAPDKTGREADRSLAELLALVRSYPACERLQVLAARALDAKGCASVSRRVWSGIHGRFPQAAEPFRMALRWLVREAGLGAALEWLDVRFPVTPALTADLLVYAWGHHELKSFGKSDDAFKRSLAAVDECVYLQFSKALAARGEIWRAHTVLTDGIAKLGPHRKLVASLRELGKDIGALNIVVPKARSGRVSDAVLSELFARAAAQPRRLTRKSAIGRVAMITGSLGAGGAERQFAMTSQALRKAAIEGTKVAGYPVQGPIEVYCRSLHAKPGGDFFLSMLQRSEVPVFEYSQLESKRDKRRSIIAPHRELLRFLPGAIAEGTLKLADEFRLRRPDIVQIWQDGSIYATGLAALLAGIPRIVLNVRTLPPIDRPDRFKPEYELIFRSMLSAPNVVLTANSKVAARRYAEWLSMRPEHVHVIYNGVDLPESDPSTFELDIAAAFRASTDGSDFTVGGIMRFDENKRPLLWLETAAALLQSAPRTRFILVGEGPLWNAARSYARTLGIAERVLFVGRSHAVKFWLHRMDVFLLLSLHEGLPNVLVEAQQAGIPVCTTAAGGCAEAICPGKTGLLLPADEATEPRLAATRLLELKDHREKRMEMGEAAKVWAHANFSVSSMIEKTAAVFMDGC